jgi:hypothetical protein
MKFPMRAVVTAVLLLVAAGPFAHANELVILPPVASGDADAAPVAAALRKVRAAQIATRAIDLSCASDPGCLVTTGSELGARRALSVTVTGDGRMTLLLVDVGANLLLGTREISVAPKKLAKDLPPAIAMFVDTTIVDKAKALFAEGNQHYNLGEFRQALGKYKLAYRVKALPAFQFNIAQCHRKLEQHKEAIAMYQAYLVDVPGAQNRTMVESLLAESKQAIDAQAALEHERERLATERQKADAVRRIKEADAVAKAEAARAEQARIAAERERESKYNRHPARKIAVAASVLGLAAGGVGSYFALQARDQQRGFDNAGCGDPMRPLDAATLASCTRQREDGERSALYANIGIATGGAFVLTGLILLIVDPGNIDRPRAGASVAVTPTSVGAVIRW